MLEHPHEATPAPDRRAFLELAGLGVLGVVMETSSGVAAETASIQKRLIVHSASPMNAEPALSHLVESWITPIKHFYVRSHAPTPQLDAKTFRLSVEGLVEKKTSFTVAELKERFRSVSAIATLTCAGNRRNEHSQVKRVAGVQWGAGPIGNAQWSGIRLSDLLKAVGVQGTARHVWFESVDKIQKGGSVIPFGGSIPLEKALDDRDGMPGAMLAFGMNGQPLQKDHGFPLRTVVPGFIGARSVKWLGKIILSDRPSPNHYLATAYKLVTESTDQAWEAAEPIYRFPLNSVICQPGKNAKIARGKIRIAGYALPAGMTGNTIARVETSTDSGKTWSAAQLHRESHAYCWRLWHADVQVGRSTQSVMVRAVDTRGNIQPKTIDWNLKGYLFNAWHRVPVRVS